jgi:hypothetical protein
MAKAVFTVQVGVRIRWRRFEHMKRQAIAEVRRAPRRERSALVNRWVRRMAAECTSVSVESPQQLWSTESSPAS